MTDVYAVTVLCPHDSRYSMPIMAFDTREAAVDFIETRLAGTRTDSVVPEIWRSRHERFRVQWIEGDGD